MTQPLLRSSRRRSPERAKRSPDMSLSEQGPVVNTTPLIDVMLVLLVMFIITIPIQLHQLDMNVATSATDSSDLPPPVVYVIAVNEASHINWQGQAVNSLSELEALLDPIRMASPSPVLRVNIDPKADYETVVDVLSIVKTKGLERIQLSGHESLAP